MSDKKFAVCSRAVIFHEGKLLVVAHPHDTSYYALPGGHLEWGEGAHECLKREIVEELGVEPAIGRLLYVNMYMEGENVQAFEFFFEVLNGADYVDICGRERTHQHEISSMRWVAKGDQVTILPKQLELDLQSGNLFSHTVRFLQP
ncbi:MAG: NUDIX domain-containing protein [Minisyncoccia bacterium]